MDLEPRATVEDLMRVEGQAELIGGRIVRYPPFQLLPGRVAAEIAGSLHDHCKATGRGEMGTATLAYVVPELSSGRESFCADVSYYDGPHPANPMGPIEGPPTFAVEIRGPEDYTSGAEREMASKRADYFEAGTLVVWDVDPIARVVRAYRPGAPGRPAEFGPGQVADAEPAVPGWRVAVDNLFP